MLRSLPFIMLLALLFSLQIRASAQEPTVLSLKGYGGDNADNIGEKVTPTSDGGFIISLGSNSVPGNGGNIDAFCNFNNNRNIFIKYNADASRMEWSKCFGQSGDTGIAQMFPTQDGGSVLFGMFNSNYAWGTYFCKQDIFGNIVWSKSYSKGNDALQRDVITTKDGGYLILNESHYTDTNVLVHYSDFTKSDLWILKVDSSGNKLWSRVIGGTGDERGIALVADANDGYYIIGSTESQDYDMTGYHGGLDGYVARLDKDGNIIWHKDVGGSLGDALYSACSDGKGGLLIAGATFSGDGDIHHHIGGLNFWVANIDSSGNILWENCYGGKYEQPYSIAKSPDGSIWVGGYSKGRAIQVLDEFGKEDSYLVHLDANGNLLSTKTLGSSMTDITNLVYPLTNSLVLIGGLYGVNDGSFNPLGYYDKIPGGLDAFLAIVAPWTTSIKTVGTTSIKMYPNPVTDILNITSSSQEGFVLLISATNGQAYFQSRFFDKLTVSVSNWPRGVYYVQLTNSDGFREISKIVIQ